ncbi:unnamed protein product, partial [Discosporangium mesarthrocarpum]
FDPIGDRTGSGGGQPHQTGCAPLSPNTRITGPGLEMACERERLWGGAKRGGTDKFMAIPTPHTVIPAQAGTQLATQAIAKYGEIECARLGPDFRQDDG